MGGLSDFFGQAFRTFLKNSFVLSFCGCSKKSFGLFSSVIFPSDINKILVPTSFANPISCVTMTIVIPSSASSLIRSRTSPTISGSSADVGSSKSMTLGFIASALAMAIRCFCPPDKVEGYASAFCSSPILFRSRIAFSSACALISFFDENSGATTCFSAIWFLCETARSFFSIFAMSFSFFFVSSGSYVA